MNKKYFTYTEYGCHPEEGYYCNCVVRYAMPGDEEYDGYNMVGRGGDEGFDMFISNNLEDAIINAHFNPEFIQFELTQDDMKLKDEILSKYAWDREKGLVKIKIDINALFKKFM